MWKFCNLPLHNRKIYTTLTSFSVLPFILLPVPRSVHVWPQIGNELSTWFPWLHWIEGTCQFLIIIYHCSTKQIDFKMQTSMICKKEKATSCEKWLLGGVLQKRFSKNFTNFTEKYLCYSLLLILLETFRSLGLQLIEERPLHWCFRASRFKIIYKISRKILKNYLTGAFQAFYTRSISSHSKAFICLKSLKTVCHEVSLLWSCDANLQLYKKRLFHKCSFMYLEALKIWEHNFFLEM